MIRQYLLSRLIVKGVLYTYIMIVAHEEILMQYKCGKVLWKS